MGFRSRATRIHRRALRCPGGQRPGTEDDGAADEGQPSQPDERTYEKLFDAFFPRLVALSRLLLHSAHRRFADEEDIALSAIEDFFHGLDEGRFELADYDETWHLLVVIAARKVIDLRRREMAQKRGQGNVLSESRIDDAIEQLPNPRRAAATTGELNVAAEELMRQLGSDVLADDGSFEAAGILESRNLRSTVLLFFHNEESTPRDPKDLETS